MAFVAFDNETVDADNSGATSYGGVAGLREYAADRNKSLPASSKDCEILLTKAMDWLDSKGDAYKGLMTDFEQPLQWPRCGVYLNGSTEAFDDEKLPALLIKAQYELACILNDTDIWPVSSGAFVKREKVDVIEVEYSDAVRTSGLPDIPSVDAILGPLLDGGGFRLTTVRG